MREKGGQPILVALTTLLFLAHHVEGQEAPPNCTYYTADRAALCAGLNNSFDLASQLANGLSQIDACVYSLKDYACLTVPVPSNILAPALKCAITDLASDGDPRYAILLFQSLTLDKFRDVLNLLATQLSGAHIAPQGREMMMKAAWQRLYQEGSFSDTGFLSIWFQERLHYFLPAINQNILDCMASLPCDGLETMVQALDNVYDELENTTVLTVVGWIQTTLASRGGCPRTSMTEWIAAYWSGFSNVTSLSMFSEAWSGFNASAALEVLDAQQLAEYAVSSGALLAESNSMAVMSTLNMRDVGYVLTFLDRVQALSSMPHFNHQVLYSLLSMTLMKVTISFPDVCVATLKELFQVHLRFLLVVIDKPMLDLIPRFIGCSDYHDISNGLDAVYDQINEDQKMAVLDYKREYLSNQTLKDGSACTLMHQNSTQWLENNLGPYSVLLTFQEIQEINHNFIGFDAAALLSGTQLADLVVQSGVLVDSTVQDAEMKVGIVLKYFNDTFEEFTSFMVELHVQTMEANIDVVLPNVSCRMMGAMWAETVPHFGEFADSDYEVWIGERFKLFTPCITSQQIYELPSTVNCTTLHAIVHGFNAASAHMNSATQHVVAKWIYDYLNVTQCPSENWLIDNFGDFSGAVTVPEIMCLNPSIDLTAILPDLTSNQVGYAAVVIPGALETVTIMDVIFDALVDHPTPEAIIDNLGVFWDSFTVAYDQVNLTIAYDVKYTMFTRTTVEIQSTYEEMSLDTFTHWYERFDLVIESINSTILDQVPLTISCEKYEALIAAINMKFSEIKDSNINDVFAFIKRYLSQTEGAQGVSCSVNISSSDWLQKSLGNFSKEATYTELKTFNPEFNVFEGAVLNYLTVDQVSDVIVYSTALTSMTETEQIFEYFGTKTDSEVKSCMESFTTTVSTQPSKVNISSDVGEYFLTTYLQSIETEFITYEARDWTFLFEHEMRYFVSFISSSSLQVIVPLDCGSLLEIMNQLNTAFSKMADKDREAVVDWFVNIFKDAGPTSYPRDCQANYTQSEWMLTVWQRFIIVANLTQIESSYVGFDTISALEILTTSQKIEFIMSSNALTNTTLMQIVFNSMSEGEAGMSLQTADEFLTAINVEIEASELPISREVNELIMEVCFTAVSEQFQTFTVEEYRHYFEVQFKYFLIYIKVEWIIHLQVQCTCNAYSVIIQAFDNVFAQLPEEVKLAISDFIRRFLEYHNSQAGAAGHVCGELYQNFNSSSISLSYVEEIFYSFSQYFNVSEFHIYFSSFNSYDILGSFSSQQLAEQMVADGLQDAMNAALILVHVNTLTYVETVDFLTEFNTLTKEENILVLPNEYIQNLLFKVCFDNMQEGITNTEEYGEWFGVHFQMMVSSITLQNIASLPADLSCSAQENLVSGFSENFEELDAVQGEAIHSRIVTFLRGEGRGCSAGENSTEFITKWYGEFKEYATIAEYTEVNPNFDAASALEVCSPQQIGEYAITSGALNNEQVFVEIFQNLQTTEEVSSFVTELNTNAQVQLENTEIGSVIFSCITGVISEDYPQFVQQDWTFWYQEQLTYLLPYVNETILLEIPSNIDCGSELQIVKAFNGVFDKLPEVVQKSVYDNFIKRFFDFKKGSNTGVVCGGHAEISSTDWLNFYFSDFSIYAYLGDLLTWNTKFVASDILASLSVEQLADYTVDVQVLSNDDLVCPILARLHHQTPEILSTFLIEFHQSAQKKSFTTFPDAVIRKKMFLQFMGDFQGHFHAYTPADWTSFLQTEMALFWGSLDVQTATSIVEYLDCNAYRQFVGAIDATSLSPSDRADIFNVLLNFLHTSESACFNPDEGDQEAILGLFGSFASVATYDDILTIRPAFNGLAHVTSLTAAQLAGFCLSGDNFNDYSTMSVVMNALRNMSIRGLQSFGIAINNIAGQKGITGTNIQVRDEMLYLIINGVHTAFSRFTSNDWSQFFSGGLSLLNPSISATTLDLIPEGIDCSSLQSIIAALGHSYNYMPEMGKHDVNEFVKSHLAWQKEKTGKACTANSDGSAQWMNLNFRPFSDHCNYNDFITLNPDFNILSALNEMTPQQLAQYMAMELQNPASAGKVIDAVAATSFGAFLDEFNAQLHQSSVTKLTNADVRRILLEGIFCRIGPVLQTFSADNYTEWFQNKLSYLLISINAKVLGSIPAGLECGNLAAIVHVLSTASGIYDHQEAIWDFIVATLTAQKSQGYACSPSGTNDRDWLTRYFGAFSTEFTVDVFISLKGDFRGEDCFDILTASQMSSLAVQTSIMSNASAINVVFSSKTMQDFGYLSTFLAELRAKALVDNTLLSDNRIAASMLIHIFETVGPLFRNMPSTNATHFLGTIDFLLPFINSTALSYVPMGVSCAVYQEIVKALDKVFSELSQKSKMAILKFQTAYLSAQAAEDGSACAHGITTTGDWIQVNLGHFCELSNGTEFQSLYEFFNLVSYSGRCQFA